MESSAAVETMEAIDASTSVLADFVRRGTLSAPLQSAPAGADLLRDQQEARPGGAGVDPLREQADACLDGLAEVARMEARSAALKVQLTAGLVPGAEEAMALTGGVPAGPHRAGRWL